MSYLVIPIEERIKSEAEFGVFFLKCKMSKKKASQLNDEGFEVKKDPTFSGYPSWYYVRWKNASVECSNVTDLDETDNKYSLAQKMWIISKKSQHVI